MTLIRRDSDFTPGILSKIEISSASLHPSKPMMESFMAFTRNFPGLRFTPSFNLEVESSPPRSSSRNEPDSAKKKVHECNICLMSFSKKSNLIRHVQALHEARRKYRCECGETFNQSGNLNRHRKSFGHFNQSFLDRQEALRRKAENKNKDTPEKKK
uniref:C2H2-type domain-containing protein n=1 Tax=Compsopogon caeruleus TaxID=31354 RepID=A0A7S1TGW8_9RHOD